MLPAEEQEVKSIMIHKRAEVMVKNLDDFIIIPFLFFEEYKAPLN